MGRRFDEVNAPLSELAQRAGDKSRADQLHEALRRHVIYHWIGPRTTTATTGECLQCESRWRMPGKEKHKPDCLAAPKAEP